MILPNGKRRCDREVGSPRTGWRGCGKHAVQTIESKTVRGMTLDYCRRHTKPVFA